MPPVNLQRLITNRATMLNCDADLEAKYKEFEELSATIAGWSTFHHYIFFDAMMMTCDNARILVCGVYHGFDLTIIARAAKRYKRKFSLVGVDLFGNSELADWPPAWKGKKWEEVQGNPVPSAAVAAKNCPDAVLLQVNSIDFLKEHAKDFDIVYLDTAHDYGTVSSEIKAVLAASPKPILLCGDDYHTIEGWDWGVDRAVQEFLPNHNLLFDRIWISNT